MRTASATCLFVASPPYTPVTFISKSLTCTLPPCSSTPCIWNTLSLLFFTIPFQCSLPLVNAFLAVSPICLLPHFLHLTSYVTPVLLQLPPFPSLPHTIHISLSPHSLPLNGSDLCTFLLTLVPGTSTTATLTLAFSMVF